MIFFLILLLILSTCNVSPFIKEKSVVSSLSSLKIIVIILPLQSPLHASVGMIVQFYSTLSDFVLIYEKKGQKKILSLFTKITMMYC